MQKGFWMLTTPSNNVMFIDATYCMYAERFGDAKYAKMLGECLCTQEGEEL